MEEIMTTTVAGNSLGKEFKNAMRGVLTRLIISAVRKAQTRVTETNGGRTFYNLKGEHKILYVIEWNDTADDVISIPYDVETIVVDIDGKVSFICTDIEAEDTPSVTVDAESVGFEELMAFLNYYREGTMTLETEAENVIETTNAIDRVVRNIIIERIKTKLSLNSGEIKGNDEFASITGFYNDEETMCAMHITKVALEDDCVEVYGVSVNDGTRKASASAAWLSVTELNTVLKFVSRISCE